VSDEDFCKVCGRSVQDHIIGMWFNIPVSPDGVCVNICMACVDEQELDRMMRAIKEGGPLPYYDLGLHDEHLVHSREEEEDENQRED